MLFSWDENFFQIYCLSNFQICNTILLTIVTELSITSHELWRLTILQLEVCIIGPPSTSFTLHILPLATPSPFSVSYELGFFFFF